MVSGSAIGSFFGGLGQGLGSGLRIADTIADIRRRRAAEEQAKEKAESERQRRELASRLTERLGTQGTFDPDELLDLAAIVALTDDPKAVADLAKTKVELGAVRLQRAGTLLAAGAYGRDPRLTATGLAQLMKHYGIIREFEVRPEPQRDAFTFVFIDPKSKQPTGQWTIGREDLAVFGAMLASDPSKLPELLKTPHDIAALQALAQQRLAAAAESAEKAETERLLRPLRMRESEATIALQNAQALQAAQRAVQITDERYRAYAKTLEETLRNAFGPAAEAGAAAALAGEIEGTAATRAVGADLARDIATEWYMRTGELLPEPVAVTLANRLLLRTDDREAEMPALVLGRDPQSGRPQVRAVIDGATVPISTKMASILKAMFGYRVVRQEEQAAEKKPAEKKPAETKPAEKRPAEEKPPLLTPATERPFLLEKRKGQWFLLNRATGAWVRITDPTFVERARQRPDQFEIRETPAETRSRRRSDERKPTGRRSTSSSVGPSAAEPGAP